MNLCPCMATRGQFCPHFACILLWWIHTNTPFPRWRPSNLLDILSQGVIGHPNIHIKTKKRLDGRHPSKVLWYTSFLAKNCPLGTLHITCWFVETTMHIRYRVRVCWVSFVCSKYTMILTRANSVSPYLRGPAWTWWNFVESSGTDSCTFSRSAGTLQALHLMKLCSILCVMTYSYNILKGITL